MDYAEKKLSSGLAVQIRSRSYAEWEKHEEQRLDDSGTIAALKDEGKDAESSVALQRAALAFRNACLAAWVKDFEKIKSRLGLRDIAEIEEAAIAMETPEIEMGNSSAGGSGG